MAADPRAKRTWTFRDDQAALFIFMVTPFVDIKSVLHLLPDRTAEEIRLRFLAIIDDAVLQQRMITELHNDVILRQSVAWQPRELLALAAIAAESHRATAAFQDNAQLFHPTRTLSSLTKVAAKIGAGDRAGLDQQIHKYSEWANEIARRVAGLELVADDDSEDDVPELRSQPQRRGKKNPPPRFKKRAETSLALFRGIIERRFQKSQLAAFVGRLGIEVMAQSKVTLGRASPRTKPDIDLSGYHVQEIERIHCAVALKADFQFYAEVIGPDLIIDGDIFVRGTFVRLHDGAVIDVAGIPFMFFENKELMSGLRQSA
jgi:hypothetical protein